MMKFASIFVLTVLFMNDFLLFDFNSNTNPTTWSVIDDVVMGGVSDGNFKIDAAGNGVFFGKVSTANNGGFSSVRHRLQPINSSNFKSVAIRLKGDGKKYQFRIKNDATSYYSYITTFTTSGDWETITISLQDLYPSFRGRTLNLPNFDGSKIAEIVFLIGNKKNESFELTLDSITLLP